MNRNTAKYFYLFEIVEYNFGKSFCIVTWRGDYRQGFGLEIGFIDHFNIRLVSTLNYSAIANFHTLRITTAHAKSFQSAVTCRFLVMDLNNEDSSASSCTD
jgi:hypothetical protein